ncbi:MAG: hypothetical protein Q8R04_05900 [Nanoarchaeota archaeon]|nr:hypothetical protein [Nanoarchaeota archaeon]
MSITEEIIGFIENFGKIKQMSKKALSKLNYHIFWSKEDKREWEEFVRKHQLPKDTQPTKNMKMIYSKEPIKRTTRTL